MILYCLIDKLGKLLWSMILKILRLPSHINAGARPWRSKRPDPVVITAVNHLPSTDNWTVQSAECSVAEASAVIVTLSRNLEAINYKYGQTDVL